ncbi:MAG: hypothetical protein IT430_10940 [Phycisphaerales bacterium]|nr:hypothetical protein [Phycisphaerales bacterium]
MKPSKYTVLLIGAAAAIGTAGVAEADVLVANGGFETMTETTGALPTGYGYWRGDLSSIVEQENDIRPFEGVNMLRFNATTVNGAAPSMGSELWQLVDLSDYRSMINSGNGRIDGSAFFNRVADNYSIDVDTMFSVGLYAYSGDASTFPAQWGHNELGATQSSIHSDGNVGTWEEARLSFILPEETDFIAIRIAVSEDVYNDVAGQEFAGHYVDGVGFTIIPAPASVLCLLPAAGFLGIGRRRRTA